MKEAKFEIFEDKRKEWRFRLKAANGKIIAVGESYKQKQGAINGVKSVINTAASARIVEVG